MGNPATVQTVIQNYPNNAQAVINAVNAYNANLQPGQYAIDPNDVLAYVAIESSGGQLGSDGNTLVQGPNSDGSYDYGIMQLNSYAHPGAANLGLADNATAGVQQIGTALQANGGNITAAIQSMNPNSPTEVPKWQAAGGGASGPPPPGQPLEGDNFAPNAQAYTPLPNNGNQVNTADLIPEIVIKEGLDATPWYQDSSLITGNPRLRAEVQPVSFQVKLHDNTDFILSTKGNTGIPISVQMNASMKSINWSMKHIYHAQRTRTAQHITLWGMQADTIEGHCTTGVFMNQFGLTDYYSTRVVNGQLPQELTALLGLLLSVKESPNTGASTTTTPTQSGVLQSSGTTVASINNASTVSSVTDPTLAKLLGGAASNLSSAFRVAAQDAFIEFLSLFKMNGNVWFWNKVYDQTSGMGTNRQWDGVQAWSPLLGVSTSQKNARNNDVMTRGRVVMSYRNFTYEGYFKTLQWAMDANNPFKWDFTFTFQVERTTSNQYLPLNY